MFKRTILGYLSKTGLGENKNIWNNAEVQHNILIYKEPI